MLPWLPCHCIATRGSLVVVVRRLSFGALVLLLLWEAKIAACFITRSKFDYEPFAFIWSLRPSNCERLLFANLCFG